MERNKLLKLASTVCNVFAGFQIAGIVIATIVLFHWHSDKDFYRKVRVSPKGGISFNITTTVADGINTTVKQKEPEVFISSGKNELQKNFTLAELKPATVYFLYVKGVLIMIFMLLIFKEFGNVVRSVRSFQTFREANVQVFRKVGKYLLFIFLISGPGFFAIETAEAETSSANVSLDFDFTPLILMLIAYVLAEIFKEGNRLYEEEQLTV